MNSKRIVVAGASGLVGGRLVPSLEANGYEVIRLVRRTPQRGNERFWDPAVGTLDREVLDGAEAVVNLSGTSIAGKRWSEARKSEIRRSRLDATGLLARTIAAADQKPAVFVSTSATGFYGNGGSTVLTESSPSGTGFLADVCRDWEAATLPAGEAGVRVVHPRFGIVLAREGGMLAQLRRLFGLGLGGRIGNGEQYMSWVDIDDLVLLIERLVVDPSMIGPVNAVAPNPVTNREFTEVLGKSIGRPTVLPAPSFAVRAMMGQMADELVLVSQRAVPKRLLDSGFEFQSPTLGQSLARQLSGSGLTDTATQVASAA